MELRSRKVRDRFLREALTHLGDEVPSAMWNVGLVDLAVAVKDDDLAVLVARNEEAVFERLHIFRVQASRVEGGVGGAVRENLCAVALGRGVVVACVA